MEAQDHGRLLTQFLAKEWDAIGETRGSWCRKHRLSDSTVLRWGQGNEPELRQLIAVAEALHRPLVHILIAAGYITEEQSRLKVVPAERPSITQLITTDPTISKQEREALLHIHEAFQAVESGRAESARVKAEAKVPRPRRAVKSAARGA